MSTPRLMQLHIGGAPTIGIRRFTVRFFETPHINHSRCEFTGIATCRYLDSSTPRLMQLRIVGVPPVGIHRLPAVPKSAHDGGGAPPVGIRRLPAVPKSAHDGGGARRVELQTAPRYMFEKNAALEASVAAAEGVGISLAAYDTDEARRSLEGLSGGDAGVALPSKLHGALLQLVANLELYKPYCKRFQFRALAGLPTSGDDDQLIPQWLAVGVMSQKWESGSFRGIADCWPTGSASPPLASIQPDVTK
eukprot:gene17876-biopygen4722